MRNLTHTSLARPRGAGTVRLKWLMNEQQKLEIGARLRELRDNSPETNRSIGDHVGVAERTVAAWASGRQGLTYDHAQKVAELFDVDLDWFWRGKKREANGNDLLDSLKNAEGESQLDRIEAALAKLAKGQRELFEGQAKAIRSLSAVEKRLKRDGSRGKAQSS